MYFEFLLKYKYPFNGKNNNITDSLCKHISI